MLCDKRGLSYVTCYTLTRQSLGSWRRHAKQHISFINFKPLELYWRYLLALQTTTPKVFQRGSWAWIISRRWDDVPWALLSFCVNMGFCWKSWFPLIWERWYGPWTLIHCLSPIHILMSMMFIVFRPLKITIGLT